MYHAVVYSIVMFMHFCYVLIMKLSSFFSSSSNTRPLYSGIKNENVNKKDNRPAASMKPSCCIVNLSSQSADWIPAGILNVEIDKPDSCLESIQPTREAANGCQEDSSDVTSCHAWKISTKYFNADVLLQLVNSQALLAGSERLQRVVQTTEAVVFYCDATRESFELASRAWERFKEVSPAVCLCVVEQILETAGGKITSRSDTTSV